MSDHTAQTSPRMIVFALILFFIMSLAGHFVFVKTEGQSSHDNAGAAHAPDH